MVAMIQRRNIRILPRLIASIVVISAISIFAFGKAVSGRGVDCRAPVVQAMIKGTLKSGLQMYRDEFGCYPTTEQGLMALVEKPIHDPIPPNWTAEFSELPKDPWGNDYLYRMPGIHNADSYDLSSRGPDGIVDTDDDVTNWKK
jgi:general secretion pathway protein G